MASLQLNTETIRQRGNTSTVSSVLVASFALAFMALVANIVVSACFFWPWRYDPGATRFLEWVYAAGFTLIWGLIPAQVIMQSAFAAFGPGNSVIRVATGAIVTLVAGWATTYAFFSSNEGNVETFAILYAGIMVLTCYCMVQVPLWWLRAVFGWRLGDESYLGARGRFKLQHLFGWFAFLALPLFLLSFLNESGGVGKLWVWYVIAALATLIAAFFIRAAGRRTMLRSISVVAIGSAVGAVTVTMVLRFQFVLDPFSLKTAAATAMYAFAMFAIAGAYLLNCIKLLGAFGFHFSTFATRLAELGPDSGERPFESGSETKKAALAKPTPHPLD